MVKADPSFLIIMVLMPLVAMAFLKGAFAPAMAQLGVPNANGSEQVVPGTAVTFSFFLVGNVGFVIFREHGWHTWVRLRASPASTSEILAGKILTPVLSSVLQLTVLFGVGAPLYGLTVQGSVWALIPVSLALAVCLTMLGLALAAVCRTVMQLNSIVNVGTILMGGLGGALTPLATLPGFTLPGDISATSRYYAADIGPAFELDADGCLTAPSGPGTGVEVDLDAVDDFTVESTTLTL